MVKPWPMSIRYKKSTLGCVTACLLSCPEARGKRSMMSNAASKASVVLCLFMGSNGATIL